MCEVAFVSHDAVAIVFEVSALLGLVFGVVDLGALEAIVGSLVAAHVVVHVLGLLVAVVVDLVEGHILLLLLGLGLLLSGWVLLLL